MSAGIIKWRKRFEMGIPLIDRQHRELLEMTNRLSTPCPEGEDAGEHFHDAAQWIIDALRQHFSTEEQMMLLLGYADFTAHKTAHGECTNMISNRITDIEQGEAAAVLVQELREWLFTHFAEHDKLLTTFVKRLRRQGKLEAAILRMPAHTA